MRYLQMLIFYFLCVIENVINFLFAIIGLYPSLEFSMNFMLGGEARRIVGEIAARDTEREEQSNEALMTMHEIVENAKLQREEVFSGEDSTTRKD